MDGLRRVDVQGDYAWNWWRTPPLAGVTRLLHLLLKRQEVWCKLQIGSYHHASAGVQAERRVVVEHGGDAEEVGGCRWYVAQDALNDVGVVEVLAGGGAEELDAVDGGQQALLDVGGGGCGLGSCASGWWLRCGGRC